MISMTGLTLLLLAYLIGSVSGARIAARLFHFVAPDTHGSKNPGASNVFRLGGAAAGLFTLLFDAIKGALPVTVAILTELTPLEQIIVGLFAIVGHLLPVFHGFHGGKGVATSLGAGLVLAPATTSCLALLWGLLVRLTRTSSVASLSCALIAPILAWQLNPDTVLYFLLTGPLIILRHRDNIIKLVHRQENRF